MNQQSTKAYWIFRHGQFVSQLGNSCFLFATTLWLTFNQDHSSTVALISSIPLFVAIILGPFVGAIVDNFNARKLLLSIDCVGALLSFCLALLYWHEGKPSLTLLIGLAIISIGHSIFSIFYFTLLEKLYEEFSSNGEERLKLRSQTITINQIVSLIGPSFGGLIVKSLGPIFTLFLDASTYLYGAISAYLSLRKSPNTPDVSKNAFSGNHFQNIKNDAVEGLRYIYNHKALRDSILTFMLINLFVGGEQLLLGFYIKEKLKLTIVAVPLLMIPSAFIGLMISTKIAIISDKITHLKLNLVELGIILFGLFYLLLLIPHMITLVLFTILVASVSMVLNVIIMNEFQEIVPYELQGRVFSSILILAQLTAPLSILLTAYFIDHKKFGINGTIWTSFVGLMLVFIVKRATRLKYIKNL